MSSVCKIFFSKFKLLLIPILLKINKLLVHYLDFLRHKNIFIGII